MKQQMPRRRKSMVMASASAMVKGQLGTASRPWYAAMMDAVLTMFTLHMACTYPLTEETAAAMGLGCDDKATAAAIRTKPEQL